MRYRTRGALPNPGATGGACPSNRACFFNDGTPCQAGLSFFVCSGMPGFDHWAAGQGCDGVKGKGKDR